MQLSTQQVDSSSIAVFRISFGLVMLWEALRYFNYGWISRYYIKPDFFFTYLGFDWVQPWDDNGMYIHFFFVGLLGFFIAAGLLYRLSTVLFFLGFTYIFLLDKSNYLNHFYLISLLSFLLIWLPLNRSYSLDALLWPKIRRATVDLWVVWALRLIVGMAYFYGGLAKLNLDWLGGEPMRTWLFKEDYGSFNSMLHTEFMVYFISYGGLLFDLLIVPMLIWSRTRLLAYIMVTVFHLTNAFIFSIGIFPWMMIALTTIFFEPGWAKAAFKRLGRLLQLTALSYPLVEPQRVKPALRVLILVFFGLNLLIPFRHFLIPGNVHWTEEGHRFSWHMKLRDKNASAKFTVIDEKTGKTWKIKNSKYLSKRQRSKMASRPDMLLQFAHHLKKVYQKKGYSHVNVMVESTASLNARPKQFLVKPNLDLSKVSRHDFPANWIAPLSD